LRDRSAIGINPILDGTHIAARIHEDRKRRFGIEIRRLFDSGVGFERRHVDVLHRREVVWPTAEDTRNEAVSTDALYDRDRRAIARGSCDRLCRVDQRIEPIPRSLDLVVARAQGKCSGGNRKKHDDPRDYENLDKRKSALTSGVTPLRAS